MPLRVVEPERSWPSGAPWPLAPRLGGAQGANLKPATCAFGAAVLSLRASCCKEPVTHRTRENRMTVPERLLSRLEMVSGSVTTFSNPFSLTDLFHNAKELHLGFQRQAKVWGPLLPGLPCVCPQSPKTTCSPHTHRSLATWTLLLGQPILSIS